MASSSSSSVDKTHLPLIETVRDQFCSLAKLQNKRWADNPTWAEEELAWEAQNLAWDEEEDLAWEADQEWGHALYEQEKLLQDTSGRTAE